MKKNLTCKMSGTRCSTVTDGLLFCMNRKSCMTYSISKTYCNCISRWIMYNSRRSHTGYVTT